MGKTLAWLAGIVAVLLLAGCENSGRVLRTATGDLSFQVTSESSRPGAVQYYVQAFQNDGSGVAKTLLHTSTRKGLENMFTVRDHQRRYVLIIAEGRTKSTLWLVFDRTDVKFMNPMDIGFMNNTARQAGLTSRDTTVFAAP